MKLRVISLLLAIVLTVLMLPAPASAVATEAAKVEEQIRTTYKTALRRAGRYSFNGYCGSLVNWQTYLLGIDTQKYGCDGKNEYDLYTNLGTTTGGYKVKSYPASQYTLRSALNAITNNGKVDAYNILVGFQKTSTSAGSIYGHAVLIHAILDGVVYFAESYATSIGGKYWAEGAAISCSIDTFCDAYDRWTVFDGVAYFGLKTYADACKEYPASMHAMAMENIAVYAEPSDPGVYEAEKTGDTIVGGQMVKVTALLQTPGGGYWYRLDGVESKYIQADKLVFVADCYDDLQIANLKVPTALRRGAGFVLRGAACSQNSLITEVKVSVYGSDKSAAEPLFSGAMQTEGKSIDLSDYKLDRHMTFRSLQTGNYRIQITAQVENYRLSSGIPVVYTNEVVLWDSAFRIITDWEKYATVEFDANGGETELWQTVVRNGQSVGVLPGAARPGYILSGWALDAEGLNPVNEETVINDNTTLYAQWTEGSTAISGWKDTETGWGYYENGKLVATFKEISGSEKTVVENWNRPGGALVAAGIAINKPANETVEPAVFGKALLNLQ